MPNGHSETHGQRVCAVWWEEVEPQKDTSDLMAADGASTI